MVFPVKMAEHVLILLLARAKHNDLHIILAQLIHNISDQVKSLLPGQSGHNADHHGLFILIQSKLLLQGTLVFHLLLTEISRIVLEIYVFIRLRIELFVINTVHNAAQISRSGAKQTV